MRDWKLSDLEYWEAKIQDKVQEFGLSCFDQEFEICNHDQMLGYMAYSGIPSHYSHWSYGKSFEKLKTMYNYGVSGLPYEMVINSDPSIAYLMRDNTLCLQILTIAHVYGHNDFFKNNFTFNTTNPQYIVSRFKAHADQIRSYIEDPSIGVDRVERILDAAHSLSFQCRRNLAIKKLTPSEDKQRLLDTLQPKSDPFRLLTPKQDEIAAIEIGKVPVSPEEDILLFIRDYNPFLADWEKNLLTIVHEEAQYFIPQIETKIMNEGWASYWHHKIMNSLDLPQDLYLEFIVRHNQIVRPIKGSLNPYNVGLKVWENIRERFDNPTGDDLTERGLKPGQGLNKMFEVRSADRDVSFLRRFLTEDLMRELNLIRYEVDDDGDIVISDVSDKDGWKKVKNELLQNIGISSFPVIRITDAGYITGNRTLQLEHAFDGRTLNLEYAAKTIQHIHALWGQEVILTTTINGDEISIKYSKNGLVVEQ